MIALLKRFFGDEGRLRLTEALKARGVAMPLPDSEAELRRCALATRRCVLCVSHERCDEALERRDWQALREICPNGAYIELLAAPPR
jgi:hypothetical protein